MQDVIVGGEVALRECSLWAYGNTDYRTFDMTHPSFRSVRWNTPYSLSHWDD